MFSRSTLRYALVATVAAASAMAMVATAAYAHNDGFNERIAACFDSRDPNSDECLSALEVSPVGADFFAQLATNVANRPAKAEPKPEPKPETSTGLWTLMKACVETKDRSSDQCQQAQEASGLSADDFKAKLAAKFGCVSASNHDGGDPCTKKVTECASASNNEGNNPCAVKPAETYSTTTPNMRECFSLRSSVNAMSARDLATKAEKIAAVCRKAVYESRMSAGEFWKHR